MNSYYEKMLATGEVKCIDEEVPFEIPKGWEWTRIGNIFNHTTVPLNPNRSLEKASCHFLMTAIRKIALYMLDS